MTGFNDDSGNTGESSENKSPDQGTSKGGTVVNLASERYKRKKKDQINRGAVLRTYLKVILQDPFAFQWPKFPVTLRAIQLDGHSRTAIVVNEGQEIDYLSSDGLINLLAQYSSQVSLSFGAELALKSHEMRELSILWLAESEAVNEADIAPTRFLSEKGYTYRKLDFDPDDSIATPTFDEMFGRIDNRELVLAWIGSLFEADSSRQNYLWLHGTGGQGKSSLSLFLKQCFGRAYKSECVPDASSKRFWASGILGSRLVVFPDCNESYFVTTSMFKQITGGDPVRIEAKGQNPTARDLACKCMFISNNQPDISGLRAEVRRLILAEIAPLPDDIEPISHKAYLAKLWAERAGFIGQALKAYYSVFKDHGDLSRAQSQSMAGLADLIGENESWASDLFEQYFVLDKDSEIPSTAIGNLAKKERWKNTKTKKFKEYLERKAPYVKVCRDSTGNKRIIKGLAFKTAATAKHLLESSYDEYRAETSPLGMDDSF